MTDLFEHYETLPQEVQDLILTITDEFDYEDCKQMVLSLNDLGYTCEYGLDAQLFYLLIFPPKRIKTEKYLDSNKIILKFVN